MALQNDVAAVATEVEAIELDEAAVKCLEAGDEEGAISAATKALDIFEDVHVHADMREAACYKTLTMAHLEAKDTQAALKVAKDCVERFQDSSDRRGHGAALQLLSLVQSRQGFVGKAVRSAQRAAYAFDDAGYQRGRAEALVSAGKMWSKLGLFNKALRLLQEALTDFEELNDVTEQASTLRQRAEVCLLKKDTKGASRCAIESRELFQDAQDKQGEASALLQLCAAQMAEGDLQKAARSAEEAQGIASDARDKATEAAVQQALVATEADAYRAVADVSAKTGEYEAALKAGQRALALYRDLGDRQLDEASTLIANAGNQIMATVRKEERGQATEKTLKEGSDRALKYAKEALSHAKRLSEPQVIGAALQTVAQCYTMAGKPNEAMKAANEGLDMYRQHSDLGGEASMLINISNITLLLFGDIQKARDAAEEGVWLFQQIGDAEGEDQGWEMLDRIQKAVEEKRKEAQLAQQQQQMAMAMQQLPAGGMPANLPPQEEAMQEHEAKKDVVLSVSKLDVGAGLSPQQIHKQISDIAKALIGEDDDIDLDTPLMEAGLTSNTAVQLRNGLSENMPGINLPVTLTFDYPSIGAMTDLVLESAKKIKR